MKGYEKVTATKLMRRTPVIIRIDGKAFHTMTKRWELNRPFDERMHKAMAETTLTLCHEIQNAVFGYTQSDEISILLRDWDAIGTQQWFDGKVQKICSVAASIATIRFAMWGMYGQFLDIFDHELAPMFDARVYNIPKEEVVNYFIWRQQDATRNSVQMLGRAYFSHKELHGKSNEQVQEMLWKQHGVNWDQIDTWKKRGSCVRLLSDSEDGVPFQKLYHDSNPPIFTQDRDYMGCYVNV